MASSLTIILDFIFRLACLAFLVRFLLQAANADFYNPLSQAIVKATEPVCKPLRRLIRPIANLDLASLFVAWLISALFFLLLTWLRAPELMSLLGLAWAGVIRMLLILLQFYFWTILIVIIASFVAQGNYHPVLALLHQLTEPLMAPIRKVLPPLGPLDLTPMVVIIILSIAENILTQAY